MSPICTNNSKASTPHKVHVIELKKSVEDYSKCWLGLSSDPLGSVPEEAVTLSYRSRPTHVQLGKGLDYKGGSQVLEFYVPKAPAVLF